MALKKGPAIKPVLLGEKCQPSVSAGGGTELAHADGHRVAGLPINGEDHLDIALATQG